MVVKGSTTLRPVNFRFDLQSRHNLGKLFLAHPIACQLALGHRLIVKRDKKLFSFRGELWMQKQTYRVVIIPLTQEIWFSGEANVLNVL